MARVNTQSIPPDREEDYTGHLGKTRELTKNHGSNTWELSCVSAAYPDTPHQSRHPSPSQEAQMTLFEDACEGWRMTTARERAAYYQASSEQSWFYYNYFMSRNMRAMHEGQDWEELQRPAALHYDLANGTGEGYLLGSVEEGEETDIFLDIEIEPANFVPSPLHPWQTTAMAFTAWHMATLYPPSDPYIIEHQAFEPTERTRYEELYELIPPGNGLTFWEFRRLSDTIGPCIVWAFELNETQFVNEQLHFRPYPWD